MKSKLTQKQRVFVEAVARGCNQSEAYRVAYDCSKKSDETVYACSSRLISNAKVSEYLNELREAAKADTVADMQEVLEFHTRVLRTPLGEVGVGSQLCQSYKENEQGSTITMPSKIDAARELCRIQGFYAADKVRAELTGRDGEPLITPALDLSQADVLEAVARLTAEAQARVNAREEAHL